MPTSSTPSIDPKLPQMLEQALRTGLEHHNAGRLEHAGQLYRAILQANPDLAEANYGLGRLLLDSDQAEDALEFLTKACATAPETGSYWLATADCLLRLHRSAEAVALLESAMQAGLEHPQAEDLLSRGRADLRDANALAESAEVKTLRALATDGAKRSRKGTHGKKHRQAQTVQLALLQQALDTSDWRGLKTAARRLLANDPVHGIAWALLGMACLQLGGNAAALVALSRASELLPKDAVVWDHLGVAQRLAAQHETSRQSFNRSLALDSSRPETWINLGNLQIDQVQTEAAIASFHRALALDPVSFAALSGLGNAQRAAGQLEAAAVSLLRALEINPHLAEVHSNLGNVQRELGQVDIAIASYQRAAALNPNHAEAHSGLARALIDCGEIVAAVDCYLRALDLKPDLIGVHTNLLQSMNSIDYRTPEDCLAEARRYGRSVAEKVTAPYRAWLEHERSGPLRVGLVSGDLRNHPVGYFLENLLREIDPGRLKIVAYTCSSMQDGLSARLQALVSDWTSLVGISDEIAARRIHDDGIQVLLDLSGHTGLDNRLPLFAWKPAPVQATWLGYFATTGMAEMDYLLADPYVAPIAENAHFAETVWRLPESYLCFTPPDIAQAVGPLPALTAGRITFGCFNNLNKMDDAVVALWSRVLLAVPGSRLLLKTKRLNGSTVCATTRARFAAHGIGADRLWLEGDSPRAELLATYHRVDIALDPFPYPGGTTSVEGLWMGVPVITRRGNRFLSHIGESIAHNAGLADWIAIDDDDYVAKAIAHSADLQRLAALRAALRQRVLASPLFDAPRFARHFEAALWGMWEARRNTNSQCKCE